MSSIELMSEPERRAAIIADEITGFREVRRKANAYSRYSRGRHAAGDLLNSAVLHGLDALTPWPSGTRWIDFADAVMARMVGYVQGSAWAGRARRSALPKASGTTLRSRRDFDITQETSMILKNRKNEAY